MPTHTDEIGIIHQLHLRRLHQDIANFQTLHTYHGVGTVTLSMPTYARAGVPGAQYATFYITTLDDTDWPLLKATVETSYFISNLREAREVGESSIDPNYIRAVEHVRTRLVRRLIDLVNSMEDYDITEAGDAT